MSNGSGCERGPGTRQVQLAGGAEEGLGPSGFFGIFFFFAHGCGSIVFRAAQVPHFGATATWNLLRGTRFLGPC